MTLPTRTSRAATCRDISFNLLEFTLIKLFKRKEKKKRVKLTQQVTIFNVHNFQLEKFIFNFKIK